MLCGHVSSSGEGLETHEMASGPGRAKALTEPAAWLRLCGDFANGCHSLLQGGPVVIGLALKRIADPEHYDLEKVNELRGRVPGAVTQAEVDAMVAYLESEIGGRAKLTRGGAMGVVCRSVGEVENLLR